MHKLINLMLCQWVQHTKTESNINTVWSPSEYRVFDHGIVGDIEPCLLNSFMCMKLQEGHITRCLYWEWKT